MEHLNTSSTWVLNTAICLLNKFCILGWAGDKLVLFCFSAHPVEMEAGFSPITV